MNVVCSFVGVHALEIVHVPHDAVIVHDAVGAENVTGLARRFQRNGHVVHLQHGNMRRVNRSVVLQPANVQRQQLPLHDLRDHPRQFFLHQLVRSNGFVGELLTRLGVFECLVVTRHGRPQRAPSDSIARLVQAT